MALDESILPGDVKVEVEGIPFVFMERFRHYVDEVRIDFDPASDEGFVIASQFEANC